MDFRFAPEVEVFRREVAAFLDQALVPADLAAAADPGDLTGLDEEFERSLLARAGARGILGISLPTELGGGGRPPSFQAAANMEIAARDAPLIDTAATLLAGPVLAFGSPEQRARLVPAIAAGTISACIAYSEPEAGSDLGALRAEAHRDASGYVLSGTKVLVTGAWKADWCATIARTRPDVPARQGLSMFLVPMDTAGITVRRRRTMNRWCLGEVEFHQVRLGSDALLGDEHAGWRQLAAALATEGGGTFHVGFAQHVLALLVDHVRGATHGGRHVIEDAEVRAALAELHTEVLVAERLAKRAVWTLEQGGDPTVAAAMAKVYASELLQRMAVVASDVVGADATELRPLFETAGVAGTGGRFAWEYLERVHGTIGGGTSEIKRTLLATLGLGLPRGA